MRLFVARFTLRWSCLVLHNDILAARLVTPRARHRRVFANECKRCARMIEGRCLPLICRVTLRATHVTHQCFELAIVRILMANLAPDRGKVEYRAIGGRRIMAPCTRNGNMRTPQSEPG